MMISGQLREETKEQCNDRQRANSSALNGGALSSASDFLKCVPMKEMCGSAFSDGCGKR